MNGKRSRRGTPAECSYWQQVPPPRPGTVDHAPATLRLIGAAYDAAADERYSMTVDPLSNAFDALVHVDRTGPARLLG
jgi:erythromycin esterase-like protein